jgi:thymidine kinase
MAKVGKVIAYVGTMGSGKTAKLISIYNKLSEQGKYVKVFKHSNDIKRDGHDDMVISRNGDSVPAIAISSLAEIIVHESESVFDAILVDEIQFFNDEFTIETLEGAALVGIDVYVFGLDVNSDLKTFGLMGEILARADEVKKIKSKCHKCGAIARVSEFVGDKKEGEVHVGDLDEYQPSCRACFYADKDESASTDDAVVTKDEFYEFRLKGDGYTLEVGVYDQELTKAGYTVAEVRTINSSKGLENLLQDLGYKLG